MRHIMMMVFIIFILSGCATFRQMEKGLNILQGKNIQTAFDVLGYPSGKQAFGQDTVYYWQVDSLGTIFLPATSTTTGHIGMIPVQGTTTYNQAVPVNYNCLIKLITDDKGIIKTWEYNGNYEGCTGYISKLNNYYKDITYLPELNKKSKNHQEKIIAQGCKDGTIPSEDIVCKSSNLIHIIADEDCSKESNLIGSIK